MLWQRSARPSSAARALTSAASDGRGAGVVSTQWLSRNRGADAGPRWGRQLASTRDGSVSAPALVNRNGVSWSALAYARWYHGTVPASFSAITMRRWLESIIERSVGKGPSGPR